jgi:hypothetical protein
VQPSAASPDPELVAEVRAFLRRPAAEREPHRLGKGKLHDVYRLQRVRQDAEAVIIKVRGRETMRVRLLNLVAGLRHMMATGEVTRLRQARVQDRWEWERRCTEGWQELGLPSVEYLPFPDPDVRVMREVDMHPLATYLREGERSLEERLRALRDVAGTMYIRHMRIQVTGRLQLFHEEPHTGNILYAPGMAILFDQEFHPDVSRSAAYLAAGELVALAQSALRDLGHGHGEALAGAFVEGYPDRSILELAGDLLIGHGRRWRWLRRRRPVGSLELGLLFQRVLARKGG